jgi:hypothetical protein
MCGIAECLKMNTDASKIYNLNLKCRQEIGLDNTKNLGSICRWLPNITKLVTLSLKASDQSVSYQSTQILGERNLEIVPLSNLPLDSLEFDIMDKIFDDVWEKDKYDILKFLTKEG